MQFIPETQHDLGYLLSPPLLDAGPFKVKLADSAAEITAAQELRYQVFRESFSADYATDRAGRDADLFDRHCLHVIAIEKSTRRVIGNYRVQTSESARHGAGFYAETEFDLTLIKRHAGRILELGRSCVHPDYRDGRVLNLLWAAISRFAGREGIKYMIGCVSVPTLNPPLAKAIATRLRGTHGAGDLYATPVRPSCQRETAPGTSVSPDAVEAALPPLLKSYLRLGARVCGGPAFDDEFQCADYLVMMDVERMAGRYRRHFLRG